MSRVTVEGIKCSACGASVWSRSGHDMRWCPAPCEKSFVDGGRNYTRYGHEPGIEPPELIQIEVDTPTGRVRPDRFPY